MLFCALRMKHRLAKALSSEPSGQYKRSVHRSLESVVIRYRLDVKAHGQADFYAVTFLPSAVQFQVAGRA